MKLAFVDSLSVGGGLSRFSLMLCKSLLEARPGMHIDYWVNGENLKRTPELNQLSGNIRIKLMDVHKPLPVGHRIANKAGRFINRKPYPERDDIQEIEAKIRGYDLAYFPSAHMMRMPELTIPIVGTVHDFNWRYFFGIQMFSADFISLMDREILRWLNNSVTVCSSQDVVDEARKLYPGASRYPHVIHIAPVVTQHNITDEQSAAVLKELDIDYPYLLFPGNFLPHKNHLNLVAAFALLQERHPQHRLKLLFSGVGTEKVPYGIAEKRGIRMVMNPKSTDDFNIRGMGYLPNKQVDALIKGARLMISPSLYEAICTPGMDAWSFGTPTAISDIPPFREHEKVWGIRSAFFNPLDPSDMADTLHRYLEDYQQAQADGKKSQHNMSAYTWRMVAEKYLAVFDQAIAQHKS